MYKLVANPSTIFYIKKAAMQKILKVGTEGRSLIEYSEAFILDGSVSSKQNTVLEILDSQMEDGSVKILCQGRFFYIRFHYLEQVSNLSLLEKLSDAIVGEDGTLDKLEIPPEELLDKHFKVALYA